MSVRRGVVAFALLASAASALGQSDADAERFVQRVNAAIRADTAASAPAALCARLVDSAFNIDAMLPTISAGAAERMSPAQRAAYRAAATKRAARDCARRFHEFDRRAFVMVGARDGGLGDRLVGTRAADDERGARTFVWRLRRDAQGGFRAVDLMVDGRSLANAARDEAKAALEESGGDLDAFIRALDR